MTGGRGGQQVVYARSGVWWVQPFANAPFTAIQADGRWRTTTHLGTEYAALLVEPGYKPPPRAPELADFQRWSAMARPGQGDDFYRLNGAGEMIVYSAADFEDFLVHAAGGFAKLAPPDLPASLDWAPPPPTNADVPAWASRPGSAVAVRDLLHCDCF